MTDSHGNPLDYLVSGGEAADCTKAVDLLKGMSSKTLQVIADKGYDDDKIRDFVIEKGVEPVIPYRKNRIEPKYYDKVIYCARHAVENCFGKLKQFRAIASRYDKTAACFCGMIALSCILTWIRL